MISQVQRALAHVRQFHPEVTQVFYGRDGRWLFCTDDLESVEFAPGVDVSILEEAAAVVHEVPAAFAI